MATGKDKNKPRQDENALQPIGQGPLLWFALILIPVLVALYMTLSSGKGTETPVVAPIAQEQPQPEQRNLDDARGRERPASGSRRRSAP